MQFFPEPSTGENPPYGASINYWLKEKNDSIKLVIKNQKGDTIRTIKSKGKPGINRAWWNLRGEPTEKIVLRTKPKYANWYPLDKNRTRKSSNTPFSILAPPGTYTVEMISGDERFSQELEITKDPHSEGSLKDIDAQNKLMKELSDEMNTITGHINKIERIRRQLLDLRAIIKIKKDKKVIIEAIDSIHKEFVDLEGKMTQLMITGTGQDDVRFPSMLAERIVYLASVVAVSDFPPTDEHLEVHKILQGRLETYGTELDTLINGKFKDFMQILAEKKIGAIVTD
jgi:hypothetical protein